MVLTRAARRSLRVFLLLGAGGSVVTGAPGIAQQITPPSSVLPPVDKEYQPVGINAGAIHLQPTADIRLDYDSNIYAKATDAEDDAIVTFTPGLTADYDHGSVHLAGTASATLRRFATHSTENSNAALLDGRATVALGPVDQLSADIGWQRLVEDRGDPEARTDDTVGPRLSNALNGALDYNHEGTRIGFRAHGEATRYRYLSKVDADREFTQYVLSGRLSYRVSGAASMFGEVFANKRDFRLPTDFSGVDRDASTIGGRAGLALATGGLWSGDLGVGVFRFNPEDPTLKSRTGLSVQGSIAYSPTPRTAFTLEAFRGDVATVRSGASTRVDTRIRFGLQQEVRHNLRLNAALIYRRSQFIGAGSQRTLGAQAEVDYLVSRRFTIAATARYATRDSNRADERFDRFRGGIELRMHF
jgi:hypothetical protein